MINPTHSPRPELPLLTALRFAAAAMVVMFHCGQDALHPRWLGDFFENGYEAVSFFFVLSGFILTYIYAPSPASEISLKRFWSARVARIYPLYLFSLAVALPPLVYSVAVSHLTRPSQFVGAFLTAPLLAQAWFPPFADVWNLPAWSVSVEALFYLLFPFLARAVSGANAKRFLVAALAVAIVVGIARCWLLPSRGSLHSTALRNFVVFFPLLLLPQFLVGIAIARVYLDTPRISFSLGEALFLLASLAVAIVFRERSQFARLTFLDAVSVPLFAAVIYSGACARGPITAFLSRRLFVGLGEASYALYLLHIPLLFWWQKLTGPIYRHAPADSARFWMYFAFVIVASVAAHFLIERPGRAWLLRRSGLRRSPAVASTTGS